MTHMAVREEHPVPAMIMHWLHLVSIVVLTISGLYIHQPFLPGLMSLMRGTHIFFMWLLIIVLVARIIWAFAGRSSAHGMRDAVPDRRHFGWQRENRGTLWPTIAYYLFLRRNPPAGGKFNPLQKTTYVLWILLIALQALTGFMLWDATAELFLPLTYSLGGPYYVRMIHYLIMWLFIITTLIHVYLSAMHREAFALMLWGRETTGDEERRAGTVRA